MMSSISEDTVMLLVEGLPIIREALRKISRKLDTGEDWNIAEKMNAYTTVYNMCYNHPESDSSYMMSFLYNIYDTALNERISQRAVPSLENKHGLVFLRELVELWLDYCNYTKSLMAIFLPVESIGKLYVTPSSLNQISTLRFCDMIWGKFLTRVDEVLLDKVGSGALIDERPNDQDAQLIKKMMHFFCLMYRVFNDPDKYINQVSEQKRIMIQA